MNKTIVFIDGENFIYKIEDSLVKSGVPKDKINIAQIKLKDLLYKVLNPIRPDEIIFYAARLHDFKETKDKSQELIARQRALKVNLEKQGVKFVISGNVRQRNVGGKIVFQEKGVDVKLAVDMISLACHKKLDTAILCSSDSDLQPAVSELKIENVKTIYLGFKIEPNRGLTATTDKTILFQNKEIVEAF